jgi:hypothetical protein
MTAHTPGPWFSGFVMGTDNLAIVGDRDSVVCEFDRGWPEKGSSLRADMDLIVAAPDLLKALIRLAEEADAALNRGDWKPAWDNSAEAQRIATNGIDAVIASAWSVIDRAKGEGL